MKLGVNIDHVATVREARKGIEPSPLLAALIVQSAGADSIVAHLREDRRHIRDEDVFLLRRLLKVKFNLEMSCAPKIVAVAMRLKPDQVTLVPEKRQELTTEGGLDVAGGLSAVRSVVHKLSGKGIAVSLFVDPSKKQIDASVKAGVSMIELHTGAYADAKNAKAARKRLEEIQGAASYAEEKGLQVFAGHGLNYGNVKKIVAIKEIKELNIGHSIVSRAVLVGLTQAVREMKALMRR